MSGKGLDERAGFKGLGKTFVGAKAFDMAGIGGSRGLVDVGVSCGGKPETTEAVGGNVGAIMAPALEPGRLPG